MSDRTASDGPQANTIYGLLSMRMIRLFIMLRRSGILAQRRQFDLSEIEIGLSPDGHALYGRMVEWVIERDRLLTEGIPEADVAAVWRVLATMIDRAGTMMEEEQRLGG